MLRKFYTAFIKPTQQDEDLQNRETVLNVLLVGTIAVIGMALAILLVNFITAHNTYVSSRIIAMATALLLTVATYGLARKRQYQLAAWILLCLYTAFAVAVALAWSVLMPIGIALFGLLIILSGILLGSVYSVYAAGVIIILVGCIKWAQDQGLTQPDLSWMQNTIGFGTVAGFWIIFAIIAVVSWLFNVQMERSLHRAHRAEAGLIRQKLLLETKVEERTRELQAAQLERVQQLYRFAELGQLSTALLHELANHLTTLTIDIEGLQSENRSRVLQRAKRSIHYIDNMVLKVREQLHGKSTVRPFNVVSEIDEVITILKHRASEAGVSLRWESPLLDKKTLRCRGEAVRFRQLIANMLSNGVDAYEGTTNTRGHKHEVFVRVEATDKHLIITVTDWGKGIAVADRSKLFEPFYSTKKTGMGMGLFIAKQITEEHLHGTITLDDSHEHTTFVITLAKA